MENICMKSMMMLSTWIFNKRDMGGKNERHTRFDTATGECSVYLG
jgi:hypothetical protein